MKKRILVTGSNGQLGETIKREASFFPELVFEFTDIEELDLTNEVEVRTFIQKNNPDYIINCAGYTAVDKAESEPEKAFLVNSTAVEFLSKSARDINSILIHISTDFIFDGKKTKPYVETDDTIPLSIYAKSKLEGEKKVIQFAAEAFIIRTSWLYSEYGHNFAKTILKLAKEREKLNIVNDQFGTPTYAGDLAEFILHLISHQQIPAKPEIYHYSNEGIASWYDFASEIVHQKDLDCKINPIPSSEYLLPAIRPAYSVLDKGKVVQNFKINIPHWTKSLKKCLNNLD